jgi:hypothetical protein
MVSIFTADLIFQVVIFSVVIAGFAIELKRKVKPHAQLMWAAVVLNLASSLYLLVNRTVLGSFPFFPEGAG